MNRRLLTLALPALLGARLAHAQAMVPLFNGRDLEGWDRVGNANWRIEGNMLVADRGNGFVVSKGTYANFHFVTEVWADVATNSGIFIRATDPAVINSVNSYEVNIWDERPEQRYGTGAIVDVAAVDPMPRAGGRWNNLEITARGDVLTVVLNGQTTVNGVRDGKHFTGRIALQHGDGARGADGVVNDRGVVRFRKVELRAL